MLPRPHRRRRDEKRVAALVADWHEVLRDGVGRSIGEMADAAYGVSSRGNLAQVRLASRALPGRTAGIQVSAEWAELVVFDLDVGVIVFEYDRTRDELRRTVRGLTEVAAEYLRGGGTVVERRRWCWRRTELVVVTSDGEWRLGRRASQAPALGSA